MPTGEERAEREKLRSDRLAAKLRELGVDPDEVQALPKLEFGEFRWDRAMTQSILKLPESASLSSEQFYELCRANPDWKLERTAQGDLVIMAPTEGETGARNTNLLV